MNLCRAFFLPAFLLAALLLPILARAEVHLVDGAKLDGTVLFVHPNAPLLIVQGQGNRTLQSIPLKEVHSYTLNGSTIQANPRRDLTPEEKKRRERNSLSGDEVGPGQIGHYAKHDWSDAPILVWAKPGETGDGTQPENWLGRDGKPLTESPWKMDERIEGRKNQGAIGIFEGDILLPHADKSYRVILERAQFVLRHLTIESGATFVTRYALLGNLWVKDGGNLINSGTGSMACLGGRAIRRVANNFEHLGHDNPIFLRFCNYHEAPAPAFAHLEAISHWVHIDAGAGSLEIIGVTRGAGDRCNYAGGTIIISENSHFGNGDRAAAAVQKEATVILLDGASFGNHFPVSGGSAGKRMGTYGISGTVMFGLPERPLTRDLVFGATLYPQDQIDAGGRTTDRAFGASYILGQSGRMITHIADPTRTKVIFRPHPREWMIRRGEPAGQDFWGRDDIPAGIAAVLHGTTEFNGVHFDGFYEEGIIVPPENRARWQNVTFGQNNLAPPDRLFRDPGAE